MADLNYFSIAESTHDFQNPTTADKLRLAADYLDVTAGDSVLDVGSRRGWWAVELAGRGAAVTGLELNPDFAVAAGLRAERAGVEVRTVVGPALEFAPEPGSYDVVTCLGATFALEGYRPALAWMTEAVREGGRIAVGELHTADPGVEPDDDVPSLTELVHIAEEHGVEITGMVSACVDDWDRYESLHWANVHRWARANPDDPRRAEIVALCRDYQSDYLTNTRGLLGWTILVGVRTPGR